MKIAICFGTRPEVIKLALLSEKLSRKFNVINVFTGQHHSLFDDVKHLIPDIHYQLNIGEYENINLLYAHMIKELYVCFRDSKPDLVIVQGDTASAFCAAFCAFMMGIKIGHVEAGLRTFNMDSPFPEEFNRQVISKIAYYNWCPSLYAVEMLKRENVSGIYFVGNTIVDFLYSIVDVNQIRYNNNIMITLHRRENQNSFPKILEQINSIAEKYKDIDFIFPAHPNPIIQKCLGILTSSNIHIHSPMKYEMFVNYLKDCRGIITDSGGIQEEAISLRKKVIVCRNTTERPEGVKLGICKLVSENIVDNFEWLLTPFTEKIDNPYGNGNACENIIKTIEV